MFKQPKLLNPTLNFFYHEIRDVCTVFKIHFSSAVLGIAPLRSQFELDHRASSKIPILTAYLSSSSQEFCKICALYLEIAHACSGSNALCPSTINWAALAKTWSFYWSVLRDQGQFSRPAHLHWLRLTTWVLFIITPHEMYIATYDAIILSMRVCKSL